MIPVRNGEKTLTQCLNSVLNQNGYFDEVIVVDNNSTDATRSIIESFQHRDLRIKYVFESYQSRGAARNAGIRKATGGIVVMTDSDCIVPHDWVQRLTDPIISEQADAVMGCEIDLIENYWTQNIQKTNQKFYDSHVMDQYISVIDTKNFAIRRNILEKIMFDERMVHMDDIEFSFRLKDHTKIRYLPECQVGHYHKSNWASWLKLNFERGAWACLVYKKYYPNSDVINEEMFSDLRVGMWSHLKNYIIFPFWIAVQFLKHPFRETFFKFISELGWRTGVLIGRRRMGKSL